MAEPAKDFEPNNKKRLQVVEEPNVTVYKISRIINYIFVILISLIFIRMLLKGLGGNPSNSFVSFVYAITEPFVLPFLTIFQRSFIDTQIGVLELGTMVSIFFYILLNFAIVRLLKILFTKNNQ